MHFKNIILKIILGAFGLTIYGNSNQELEQLLKNKFEKQLELSELGKNVNHYHDQSCLILESINSRIDKIAKDMHMNDEEKEKATEEIFAFGVNIFQLFRLENNTDLSLKKELFSNNNGNLLFRMFYFEAIRYTHELSIIETLVNDYEKCLRQLIKIEKEIETLKANIAS